MDISFADAGVAFRNVATCNGEAFSDVGVAFTDDHVIETPGKTRTSLPLGPLVSTSSLFVQRLVIKYIIKSSLFVQRLVIKYIIKSIVILLTAENVFRGGNTHTVVMRATGL